METDMERTSRKPKTRWKDDIKGDLRITKINNWTKRTHNPVKRIKIVEETKTLKQ
jgi:hypothetical protein